MTIGRVRDGLKSLSACINSVVKSISAGSFAGKSPKQCHKLSNLVTDRTGIVDNEVVVVEYLAKKHNSIMKQLLLSSQLGMQRSGELREFTLCLQTESRASVQLFRRDMVISTNGPPVMLPSRKRRID